MAATFRAAEVKRYGSFIIAGIVVTLLFLSVSASSQAFGIRAEPSTVLPGDAFVLKVTGAEATTVPEGSFDGRRLSFVPCGQGCYFAVGGVDAKSAPGQRPATVQIGNISKQLKIRVKRHSFPVIHLTLPPEKVTLSDEDRQRVEKEERRLKLLWTERSGKAWQGSFRMPLENEVSTLYGVTRVINKANESIHRGIDVRGKEGEEVRASNSGTVVLAEELFYGGNTLVLDHGMGIFTVYMHLSRFERAVGDHVAGGDLIGFVGSTGRSTGPHLHFGVKAQELSVNPLTFMKLTL